MRPVLVAVGLLVGVLGSTALAAESPSILTDYTITTWGPRDGLSSGTIWALAQDADGFLWVGSDAGLLRFDGSRFTAWEALGRDPIPKLAVRVLRSGRDGTLWAGLDEPGGVLRIQGSHARTYAEPEGLPRGQVRTLIEDREGTLWAGTTQGLYRLVGDRWQPWPHNRGLAPGGVYTSHLAGNGDLLVGTGDGVYRRRPGADLFEVVEVFGRVDGGVRGITETQQGQLLATDLTTGFRIIGGSAPQRSAEQGRGMHLLTDRSGGVWVATGGQGVWRLTFSRGVLAVEKATALTGLVAEGAFSLLEDREGNVWAGTSDGLNQFARRKVKAITDLGIVAGVKATPDGSVWVGTFDGLVEFTRRDGEWVARRRHLTGSRIRALHADRAGRVLAATSRLVARLEPGRRSPVVVLANHEEWEIDSITSDRSGRVWLFDARRGLLRMDLDGSVGPVPLPGGMSRRRILLTYTDSNDRVWLAFDHGDLALVESGDRVRMFGAADGVSGDEYRTIYEDSAGVVWLGGRNGLTRFFKGRFATVPNSGGFPANQVKAVVQDEQGRMWLGTGAGIVRFAPGEFDKALAGRADQVSYMLLDKLDGVAGTPRLLSDRSTARATDGSLWFVTGRGVTMVNPRQLDKEDRRAMLAQVVAVNVDGQRAVPAGLTRLAAGVTRLEIEYSALNLTSAHTTRFRYRLDGFDTEWVDAGFRRTAFYTNLPPGSYRFHVAASASGLTWDAPAGAWVFEIQPRIYQTRWFPALGLAVISLVSWGLWQLRLARMRRQFSILLGERVRLSREIHDTLLQSMLGVALQCGALANAVEAASVKNDLTRLRRRVEEYIRECRQSIWDLRSPMLDEHDLPEALRRTVERATAASEVRIEMSVTGRTESPPRKVKQELVRIAQEAASNAIRHGGAQHIRIRLEYGNNAISLHMSDDGHGFDPEAFMRSANGHCGLITMKERARAVGGALCITSNADHGTAVEAVVPLRSSTAGGF